MSKKRQETTGREIIELGIEGVEALVHVLSDESERMQRMIGELTEDLLNPPLDYQRERAVHVAEQADEWMMKNLKGEN